MPGGAWAQTEGSTADRGINFGNAILVTAQKRAEDAIDVPISIAAISSEQLEKQSIRDLEDISLLTPGLNFNGGSQFGSPTISIRGISSTFGASTTGYYLDETPLPQSNLTPIVLPHVFDTERVEVLRGPQGTLYGSGSMGGTIRFIRPEPNLDYASYELGANGEVTEGGAPSAEVQGVTDIPLMPGRVGLRAGAFYRHEGGWVDRGDRNTGETIDQNVNARETVVASAMLKAQVSDTFSLMPSVFYQRTHSDDMDLYWERGGKFVTYTKRKQPETDEFIIGSLTADLDLGAVSLRSITSYIDRNFDQINDWTDSDGPIVGPLIIGIPVEDLTDNFIGYMYWDAKQKTFSQELRLASQNEAARLTWNIGAFYQRDEYKLVRHEYQDINYEFEAANGFFVPIDGYDLTGPLSDELGPVTYYQNQDRVSEELAGFANATFDVTDALSVTAGVRVAHTQVDITETTEGFWLGERSTFVGKQKETPISPKFSVSYEPDPNHTLYATASKGFRIGGSNPDYRGTLCSADLPPEGNPLTYGSDSLWSYEIGSKNRFGGGLFSLNASAFHIDWSDIQAAVTMPTCLSVYIDNLGKAKVDGFDLEFGAVLNDSFDLMLTAGYANARYSETVEKFGATLVAKGQKFAVPDFTGSAVLNYNGEIADRRTFATLTVSYAGSYERNGPDGVEGADDLTRHASPVTQVSARGGVELGDFTVSIFAENLLNSQTQLSRTRAIATTYDFVQPIIFLRSLRPRTVGLALNMEF
tara:strand:+ start:36361 stop:38631 length:2271 start_codon:yes stop_codon:yes gene_type:complete